MREKRQKSEKTVKESKKPKKRKIKKETKALLRKKERRSIKKRFDDWSNAVKDRDGWTCQLCGIKNHEIKENGKKAILNAHHVVPRTYKDIPDFRFDVENGITLCANCHKWSQHGPHHSGIVFSEWFRRKYPGRYEYLVGRIFDGKTTEFRSERESNEDQKH